VEGLTNSSSVIFLLSVVKEVSKTKDTMKKITTLLAVSAMLGQTFAGPVAKQSINEQEMLKLSQAQAQSQAALQVQAGNWKDDYGVVTLAIIVGVAALTVGIVAVTD
jgi:hypothetical protein